MARDRRMLDRIYRVRTIQLNQTRADEVQARDRADSETMLSQRIAALADAVAPTQTTAAAFSLAAAAHYRERLHQSASAARTRMEAAEYRATAAIEATRAARRDQNAIEKLIERATADDVLASLRAMEDAPAYRRKRHDPC